MNLKSNTWFRIFSHPSLVKIGKKNITYHIFFYFTNYFDTLSSAMNTGSVKQTITPSRRNESFTTEICRHAYLISDKNNELQLVEAVDR